MLAPLLAAPLVAVAADYKAPRTAFGDPDLQGLWTNASITVLERPDRISKPVVTPEEAAVIERVVNSRLAADRAPTAAGTGAPAAGGEVRGYNTFWLDLGSKLARVNGEIRTSWIVDPPDGRMPYSSEGTRSMRASVTGRIFDDPEQPSLGERCIIGYGSTGGPPMLNVLYNNHYQIVQSPGFVVIVVEMNHDARIIRLGGAHPPADMKFWLGDLIGRWEGDTLVVETTNMHPAQAYTAGTRHRLYIPSDAKIVERFRRVCAEEILYELTVEHARAYTQAWRALRGKAQMKPMHLLTPSVAALLLAIPLTAKSPEVSAHHALAAESTPTRRCSCAARCRASSGSTPMRECTSWSRSRASPRASGRSRAARRTRCCAPASTATRSGSAPRSWCAATRARTTSARRCARPTGATRLSPTGRKCSWARAAPARRGTGRIRLSPRNRNKITNPVRRS